MLVHLFELARVSNGNLGLGLSRIGSLGLDLLDNVLALEDLSEDNVASIQPRRFDGGDEELASVGVGAGCP